MGRRTSDTPCPECGALPVDGLTCLDQFHAILAWEAHDPELQAEHFLSGTCFNVQHPAQFTDEAREWMRTSLIDLLDRGTPVSALRREGGRRFAGSKRVLRNPGDIQPVLRSWRKTISDVYKSGDPAGAARRVRSWAASIRQELP